jgi:hypothetical protein
MLAARFPEARGFSVFAQARPCNRAADKMRLEGEVER